MLASADCRADASASRCLRLGRAQCLDLRRLQDIDDGFEPMLARTRNELVDVIGELADFGFPGVHAGNVRLGLWLASPEDYVVTPATGELTENVGLFLPCG